jgi:hypothetical protein
MVLANPQPKNAQKMYQEFNKLSGNSKIWIYNAGRELTGQEKSFIIRAAKEFCMQWKTHGKPLNSSADILNDHFLVLAVDESAQPASGCSIDDSIRFLTEISKNLGIDFFNRQMVTFKNNKTGSLFSLPMKTVRKMFRNDELEDSFLVFNHLLTTKAALKDRWLQPLKESWLKNFLTKKITL